VGWAASPCKNAVGTWERKEKGQEPEERNRRCFMSVLLKRQPVPGKTGLAEATLTGLPRSAQVQALANDDVSGGLRHCHFNTGT